MPDQPDLPQGALTPAAHDGDQGRVWLRRIALVLALSVLGAALAAILLPVASIGFYF